MTCTPRSPQPITLLKLQSGTGSALWTGPPRGAAVQFDCWRPDGLVRSGPASRICLDGTTWPGGPWRLWHHVLPNEHGVRLIYEKRALQLQLQLRRIPVYALRELWDVRIPRWRKYAARLL